MQFAARQRRLEQVRGVHGAVGLARADQRVHFVDEENVGAGGGRYLLQHGLKALLEFTAIFGAGDERAEIEREQFLVVEAFRHVAVDDAKRQPLDNRGLADARLADQHRIILGPAREHLNGSADFLVAPYDRIELAIAGSLGEIARILLQRLVGVFSRGGVGGAALAQRFDRGIEVLRRDAGIGENLAGLAPLLQREREEKTLDRNEAVAGLLARLLGSLEDARQGGVEVDLPGAAAGHFGALGECCFDSGKRLSRVPA